MASPSSVITFGYGSWGSVNLVPTLGFGSEVNLIEGPFRYIALGTHQPGAKAHGTHQPGAKEHGTHQPGGKVTGTL
jgi:hypothetical protein